MATARSRSAPRRTPSQARSRRTVARLLAAAAHVFAREGYEAATTNRIAEQAGVSVGSLYQFFPGKAALLLELRRALLAQVQLALTPTLTPERWVSVAAGVEGVVAAFETLDRAQPGLLGLLMTHANGETRQDNERLEADLWQTVSAQVQALLAVRASGLSPARREVVAAMCIYMADALFTRPTAPTGGFDPALAAEVKAALVAYLTPLLD